MLLQLDFASGLPIYQQIRNQIVLGIAQGSLAPGEKLPPIRTLADETGVNMMTVNKAYQLLKQEGYILTDRRSGVSVNPQIGQKKQLPEELVQSLRLLISEARLCGANREEILALCGRLFDQTAVESDNTSQ